MRQSPNRQRGRPPKSEGGEPRAAIIWRNSRAYGDFRPWARWGGGQEPLVAAGERFATADATTASILFGERLKALRDLRRRNPEGRSTTDQDRLATFVGYHLACKATVQGRHRPSPAYVDLLRTRLTHAARFFGERARVLLRDITSQDVQAYAVHLQSYVPEPRSGRAGKRTRTLKPSTQRRYLDALGQMLDRALSENRIATNSVRELVDLPTAEPSPTEHLELGECSLLLEAARLVFPPDRLGPPLHPLLAFHLLTGCTDSERRGIERADIRLPGDPEYPSGMVMVRPNESRPRLKNNRRARLIPLHAQLAEILVEYLSGPSAPGGPLLFPMYGSDGSIPLGDWRASLDKIAERCGYARGEIRTRRFRVSYATHRLNTSDEVGQPMTAWKLRGELGHGTEQMIEDRYGRYARHRPRRPVLEYRWEEWRERYGHRLAPLPVHLTQGQRGTLALLDGQVEGITATEWAARAQAHPGTFYPQRDRLLALELVRRDRLGRGARFRLTTAGRAVLAGITPGQ